MACGSCAATLSATEAIIDGARERQAEPRLGRHRHPAFLGNRRIVEQRLRPRHVLDGQAVRDGRDQVHVDLGDQMLTTGRLNASAMPATFIHWVMPPTRKRSIITMSIERDSSRWRNGTMP